MKQRIVKTLFAAAAITAAFSSCRNMKDEWDDIAHKRHNAFIEEFGEIDPEQDWNLASRASINVETSGSANVRIYASDGFTNKLVADYSGVSGTAKLDFDVNENTKEVYAVDMTSGRFARTAIGGTADLSTLKSMIPSTDANVTTTLVNDYTYTTMGAVKEALNGSKKNAQDFLCLAFVEFTLTPIYWHSDVKDATVGVYYKDQMGTRHEVDIYVNDKTGKDDFVQAAKKGSSNYVTMTGNYPFTGSLDGIRAKSVNVKFPTGTIFGFYISCFDDKGQRRVFYSEASLNPPKAGSYTSIINAGGKQYLGFDDPKSDGYSRDYDDLLFQLEGDIVPVDNTVTSWTLGCEDLGSNSDYDFNDVVINVEHAAGSKKAKVTALAAGGTLCSHLYFGDTELGEIHSFFGEGETESHSMINTRKENRIPSTSITIDVPVDFTMASTYMGGFNVRVGKDRIINVIAGNYDKSSSLFNTPQMICVPGAWSWPVETVSIKKAYPRFASWVGSYKRDADWYDTYDPELVIDPIVY